MIPLRDETHSNDPLVIETSRLLGEITPLEPSTVRAQRVKRAIDSKRIIAQWPRRVQRLSIATLLVTTTAAAAWWIANNNLIHSEATRPTTAIGQAAKGTASPSVVDALPPIGSTHPKESKAPSAISVQRHAELTPAVPPHKPAVPPHKPAVPPHKVNDTSHKAVLSSYPGSASVHPQLSAPAPASSPILSKARLVQRAMEALRKDKDPDTAARYLAQYRSSAGSGQLDEEALALSIETALARGEVRAKDYGERYLAKYPHGKFVALARRATKP